MGEGIRMELIFWHFYQLEMESYDADWVDGCTLGLGPKTVAGCGKLPTYICFC